VGFGQLVRLFGQGAVQVGLLLGRLAVLDLGPLVLDRADSSSGEAASSGPARSMKKIAARFLV
jgi:hypothetical protein